MNRTGNLATIFRFGLAIIQGIFGLFAAGSVIFAAHSLFLRYYAREWAGIQISGVNGCAGEEQIANGDLFEGKTLCNKPINFVPWVELYHRHVVAAAIYYCVVIAVILMIGAIWMLIQKRLGSATPFGATKTLPASEHEHLR